MATGLFFFSLNGSNSRKTGNAPPSSTRRRQRDRPHSMSRTSRLG